MHGDPPSPTLDHLHGPPPHPATTSRPEPAPILPWASAADRQAAARDAYRASVAEGKALTGAALGKMFDRSPRWGVDRIAEVRTEARQPNGGNQHAAADAQVGTRVLLIGSEPSNDDGVRGLAGSNGNGNGNGKGATTASLPIRSGNRRTDRSSRAAGAASPAPAGAATATAPASAGVADTAGPPAVRRITTTAVVAVALVAATASYDHQRLLAEMAGEGWRAWLLPPAWTGSWWRPPCRCSSDGAWDDQPAHSPGSRSSSA